MLIDLYNYIFWLSNMLWMREAARLSSRENTSAWNLLIHLLFLAYSVFKTRQQYKLVFDCLYTKVIQHREALKPVPDLTSMPVIPRFKQYMPRVGYSSRLYQGQAWEPILDLDNRMIQFLIIILPVVYIRTDGTLLSKTSQGETHLLPSSGYEPSSIAAH